MLRKLSGRIALLTARRLLLAAVFGAAASGVPLLDALATKDVVYPGIQVANVALGGKTAPEARASLEKAVQEFLDEKTTLKIGTIALQVPHRELYAFDVEGTLTQAHRIGRDGPLIKRLRTRLRARLRGITVAPQGTLRPELAKARLAELLEPLGAPPRDARFLVTFSEERPAISILPEQTGSIADLDDIARALQDNLAVLRPAHAAVQLQPSAPQVTAQDLEPLTVELAQILARGPQVIKAGQRSWKIQPHLLAAWITAKKENERAVLAVDRPATVAWLDSIASEIERAPQEGAFERGPESGKVAKFEVGKPGVALPRDSNADILAEAILKEGKEAVLATAEIRPKVIIPEEAGQYGIVALVGSATTNFKGSPRNRVKNIKRGAAILQGALIAPDEEFSLLDRLRPFTSANGYLPELVIKAAEGKTVPEIGGGLCQIGTTMFRTVLNAGLPVTARRNHSYRVSYYEPPAGMDATIYDPAPDFKFTNDTGAWLILTAQVEGTALTFELWGTKDGRTIAISDPEIFNVRKPPAKKIIETTDLLPGKIKCTERAHIGSDARFNYKVVYADGRTQEREFFSRYRPWQEVCLVGVAPASTAPSPAPTAVSSETVPSADTLGVVGDSSDTPQPPPQN